MLKNVLISFITTVSESEEYISSNLSKVSDLDSPRLKLCQLSLVLMGWCHGWYIEYCRMSHSTSQQPAPEKPAE